MRLAWAAASLCESVRASTCKLTLLLGEGMHAESPDDMTESPDASDCASWYCCGCKPVDSGRDPGCAHCAIISADEVLSRFTSKLSNCIIKKDAAHGNYLHCSARTSKYYTLIL